MSTVLYLFRHGETFDNASHIMQGQTQGQLNEKGISQALEMAQSIASEHIDVFLSSDLLRSLHTCKIIAAACGEQRVVTTALLRERDWGSFTSMYIPSLAHLSDPDLWPKDIESLEELKLRASAFLSWVRQQYPQKKVLAVGHGIINKAVQSVYYKKPMTEIAPMKNVELRKLIL